MMVRGLFGHCAFMASRFDLIAGPQGWFLLFSLCRKKGQQSSFCSKSYRSKEKLTNSMMHSIYVLQSTHQVDMKTLSNALKTFLAISMV